MEIQNFNRIIAKELLANFGVYMYTLGEAIFNGGSLKKAHKKAIKVVKAFDDENDYEWAESCATGIYSPAAYIGQIESLEPEEALKTKGIPPEWDYIKYGVIPPDEWVIAYTSHSGKRYIIRQLNRDTFQILYPPNSTVAGNIENTIKQWEETNWGRETIPISKIKAVCSIFGDVYMLLIARYLANWGSLQEAHKIASSKSKACEEPYGIYSGEFLHQTKKELTLPVENEEDFIIHYLSGNYFLLREINRNTFEIIYKTEYPELSEKIKRIVKEI